MKRGMYGKIKNDALLSLRLRWGQAVALLLFFLAVLIFLFLMEQAAFSLFGVTGPSFQLYDSFSGSFQSGGTFLWITAFFLGLRLIIFPPLAAGIKKWFFLNIRQKEPSFAVIFDCFSSVRDFFRILWVRALVFFRLLPVRTSARTHRIRKKSLTEEKQSKITANEGSF